MSKVKPNYFSHDLHSRSDGEMMKLRMKYGMEGVGIYWCLVEMLHEAGGYLLRTEYERIAFELRTNIDTISAIVESFQLFKNDGEKLWSDSALRRIDEKNHKSAIARESINKRWKNTNEIRTYNEPNTIKGNEIKGNLKNIEESKTNPNEENFEKNGKPESKSLVNFAAQGEEVAARRYSGGHPRKIATDRAVDPEKQD